MESSSSKGDNLFIVNLNRIIIDNLGNDKFGVVDLARHAGISNNYLNKKLTSLLGKTAIQFIQEIRLNKAKELFRSEDRTAAEVAYLTGFSSPAYFSRCFRNHFGYPPGGRRQHKAESRNEQVKFSGLIPGFKCDVYVSINLKDSRRHNKWISDFVCHLREEMSAMFKEEIKICCSSLSTKNIINSPRAEIKNLTTGSV